MSSYVIGINVIYLGMDGPIFIVFLICLIGIISECRLALIFVISSFQWLTFRISSDEQYTLVENSFFFSLFFM